MVVCKVCCFHVSPISSSAGVLVCMWKTRNRKTETKKEMMERDTDRNTARDTDTRPRYRTPTETLTETTTARQTDVPSTKPAVCCMPCMLAQSS